MTLRHLVVLGVVAGVGFTMALFIAQLAFVDPKLLVAAQIGVLRASGGAAVLGLVLGRLLLVPTGAPGAAQTADGTERDRDLTIRWPAGVKAPCGGAWSQLNLSRIWSPTRRAFAMIVSAGFTAALEGKKLPSTM